MRTKLAFATIARKLVVIPNSRESDSTLLSDAYNDERSKLMSKDRASLDFVRARSRLRIDRQTICAADESHRGRSGAMGAGERPVGRFGEVRGEPCISTSRPGGKRISATPSGGWLKSSPVHSRTRLRPGSRAQMFWLEQTIPRHSPGKTHAHHALEDHGTRAGEPYLAWAPRRRPAGPMDDAISCAMSHAKSVNLQEAIAAPAWNSEHFPDMVWPARPRRPRRAGGRKPQCRGYTVEPTLDGPRPISSRAGPDWSEQPHRGGARLQHVGRRRRAAAIPGACRVRGRR